MEFFVPIVNGKKPLTIVLRRFISDLAQVLDTSPVLQKTFQKIVIYTLNPSLGGGYFYPPHPPHPHFPTPLCFPLNKSETVKAVTLPFAAFSNFSLPTFVPNLLLLTQSSLQIWGKTQTGLLPISGFLVKPL